MLVKMSVTLNLSVSLKFFFLKKLCDLRHMMIKKKENLLYKNGVDFSKHKEDRTSDLMNETIAVV